MVYPCQHNTLQKTGTGPFLGFAWFCDLGQANLLLYFLLCSQVLSVLSVEMIKNAHLDLLFNTCPTPTAEDPGYTALTFTDTFHWKSKVAEGPEGLELNRIITEQTLILIAWCRKWTGLYEICWIILPRALINLFTMVQLSLYTTVYVFLMFWKFSKQPFPTFYTRYYNSLISLHKMAPLSTELFNLNQSNQSQPSLWAVARGTAGF